MHGSESNVSALLMIVLLVGLGVAAMNVSRGSAIDYGDSRASSETRTFLAFSALASAYNYRRASADLD